MKDTIVRVLIRFPKELIKSVEEYRHVNRIPSRHEAILSLIRKGLDSDNHKNL